MLPSALASTVDDILDTGLDWFRYPFAAAAAGITPHLDQENLGVVSALFPFAQPAWTAESSHLDHRQPAPAHGHILPMLGGWDRWHQTSVEATLIPQQQNLVSCRHHLEVSHFFLLSLAHSEVYISLGPMALEPASRTDRQDRAAAQSGGLLEELGTSASAADVRTLVLLRFPQNQFLEEGSSYPTPASGSSAAQSWAYLDRSLA